MESYLKITLRRSLIGSNEKQRNTLDALKLTKIRRSRVLKDTPNIRGMITVVTHMVDVEEIKK